MGVVPLRGQVPSVLRVLHSGCHTRVRAVCYTLADPKAHGLRKAQVWEHRCHKYCVFFKLLKTEVLYCSGRDIAWDFWSLSAVLVLTPSSLQTACGSSLYSPVFQVGTRGPGSKWLTRDDAVTSCGTDLNAGRTVPESLLVRPWCSVGTHVKSFENLDFTGTPKFCGLKSIIYYQNH